MDTLKRRNEVEAIEIVKEFHDCELSQDEPDGEFVMLCRWFCEMVEERHKREDAK